MPADTPATAHQPRRGDGPGRPEPARRGEPRRHRPRDNREPALAAKKAQGGHHGQKGDGDRFSPRKNIFMQGFMMYMSGSSINIWS